MSTTLERAAVALMNRQRQRHGLSSVDVGMFDAEEIEYAKELSRAVLLAVREPDGEVVASGYGEGSGYPEPRESFTAMIDAILNEKPEGLSDV